ncbi:MAG: hypothetical protein GY862_05430 [Gammaproteobacteria bacterium]|nr:hypothetical protein [Gammaproteobacteria bacterium]
MNNKNALLIFSGLYLLLAAACSPPVAVSDRVPERWPAGLATQWGDTRASRVRFASFTRAAPDKPAATANLYYNDVRGFQSIPPSARHSWSKRIYLGIGGAVSLGLRNESGGLLDCFTAKDKHYVIGEAGRGYSIVVHNYSDHRLEAVLSVDGLDVLDGKPAAYAKPGYLIDPHSTLEIEGFRKSMGSVAAFRFGSVQESYAQKKHGDARNVGVIGLAVFHEYGAYPWNDEELKRRHAADPFPGRFATPP